MNVMAASQVLRQAAAGRQLAAPLAQVREAQDRIDQIVVGGKLQRVHAGVAKGRTEARLAPFGSGREAPAEAAVVGVDPCLLTGLGVLNDQ